MRKNISRALLILVLGFIATPTIAHAMTSVLACMPESSEMVAGWYSGDAVGELPGGG
jgi:hypothetical protein